MKSLIHAIAVLAIVSALEAKVLTSGHNNGGNLTIEHKDSKPASRTGRSFFGLGGSSSDAGFFGYDPFKSIPQPQPTPVYNGSYPPDLGRYPREEGKISSYQPSHQGSSYLPSYQGNGYQQSHQGSSYLPSHQGSSYLPSYQGNGYQPRQQGSDYQPMYQGNGYQPSYQGNGYQPSYQGSGYQPSYQGSGYQPSYQGAGYQSLYPGGYPQYNPGGIFPKPRNQWPFGEAAGQCYQCGEGSLGFIGKTEQMILQLPMAIIRGALRIPAKIIRDAVNIARNILPICIRAKEMLMSFIGSLFEIPAKVLMGTVNMFLKFLKRVSNWGNGCAGQDYCQQPLPVVNGLGPCGGQWPCKETVACTSDVCYQASRALQDDKRNRLDDEDF